MAITKTSNVEIIDLWAIIASSTMRVGADNSGGTTLSGSYSSFLLIDVAPVEAVAQVGMDITVQISSSGNFWTSLPAFKSNALTASLTTLDAEAAAAQKILSVSLQSEDRGSYLFIKDSTIADSEIILVEDIAAGQYDAADNLLATHANGSSVYGGAQQWVVEIPLAAAMVRVIYNNVDTDCDMASQTRMLIVPSVA